MLRRVAGCQSREDGLLAVLDVCQQSIRGDVSTIMVYDAPQNTLIGVARSDEPYNPEGYYRLPLREASLTGLAFRERRVVAIEDVINDPRVCQRVRGYFNARSGIAAPLLINGEAIGAILSMNTVQKRSYSQHDIDLMGALATQAARILYADLLLERGAVAENRFETLLRHAPIPIFLLDPDERIIDFNNAATDLIELPAEQLQGLRFSMLATASERASLQLRLADTSTDNTASFDSVFRSPGRPSIQVAIDARRFVNAQTTMTQVFVRNVSHERTLMSEMTQLATRDQLTGLLNRRSFEKAVEGANEENRKAGRNHTLLYLDLDQFKVVNDSCGHLAGDELLKQVAHVLRSQVRDHDVAARLGGDEFGVLLRGCDETTALQIAERIRASITNLRFVWEGRSFAIGASIGAAPINRCCADSTCANLLSLMNAVDSACYVAKDQGRNRVQVYRPDDAALLKHRGQLQWAQRLREGLDQERFFFVAQPIQELRSGQTTMVELLLRLRNEDGTVALPGTFLPAAERYDLMPDIDRWVIAHALGLAAQAEDRHRIYSINVSAQGVGGCDFSSFVRSVLRETGADPTRICFEITEAMAMRNLADATRFIEEVRSLGCRFALDDFGKGFSSYAYLKRLPVDYLKLDGEFVRGVAYDPVDFAMVEAIHNVGRLMRLQTIAEHVEDAMTLRALRGIGVDYIQGHYISKPLPIELA